MTREGGAMFDIWVVFVRLFFEGGAMFDKIAAAREGGVRLDICSVVV